MGINEDWERERVGVKRLRTEDRTITIHRRTNNSSSELVYTGELIQGWNEDFAALWFEATDEANLREKVLQVASGGARFYLLSWNVACIPAGPPLTKHGACSKPAKSVCKIPA